jgi:hypothetical protein
MITYPLRVDLADVGDSFGEDVTWHLVPKFVPKLSGFTTSPRDRRSSICDRSGHDASDRRRETVDVGDRVGVNQFVLDATALSASFPACLDMASSQPPSSQPLTGTFFCEMTTAQSFPRTPTEVILAAVMALKAYSE